MSRIECPICRNEAEVYTDKTYVCTYCGKFRITSEAADCLKYEPFNKQTAKISTFFRFRDINQLTPLTLFSNTQAAKDSGQQNIVSIDEVLMYFPKKIYDRIDRCLLNLSKLSEFTGSYLKLDYSFFPVFCCDSFDSNAFYFILKQLYFEGYVEDKKDNHVGLPNEIRLTAKGWGRVSEIEKKTESNKAFVAMSFDSSLKPLYENGIKEAIIKAGYEPMRVDAKEYNSKICDEIIASIRKSRFVISDVTGQKNGVYFEAGFAMGLGKPVIWTCKNDEVSNLHFDTRQYNHIVWENEQDLYEKLVRRIEATII